MGERNRLSCKSGKRWGTTQCFFEDKYVDINLIRVNKGGYCSKHCHKNKWNRFIVLSGKLKITLYRESGEDATILGIDMATDSPPKILHKFEALEDTIAIEVYWTDGLDPNDITRKDSGGMHSLQNKDKPKDKDIIIDQPSIDEVLRRSEEDIKDSVVFRNRPPKPTPPSNVVMKEWSTSEKSIDPSNIE